MIFVWVESMVELKLLLSKLKSFFWDTTNREFGKEEFYLVNCQCTASKNPHVNTMPIALRAPGLP